MMTEKKKKRGLLPMEEKMGLDDSSDYVEPTGIVAPTAEAELNAREKIQNVGSKVRNKMTGK